MPPRLAVSSNTTGTAAVGPGGVKQLFSIGKWKQDYKDFQSLAIERMRANLLMKTEKRNFFESFLFKLMKI